VTDGQRTKKPKAAARVRWERSELSTRSCMWQSMVSKPCGCWI
jgi:hypothetical protein